jgi:hypothetical protein
MEQEREIDIEEEPEIDPALIEEINSMVDQYLKEKGAPKTQKELSTADVNRIFSELFHLYEEGIDPRIDNAVTGIIRKQLYEKLPK